MARDYDHLFKLLIIGDSGVGKTSIMTRFADDIFTGTYISTIGVDFKIRTLVLNGETIRLQIWDTAGQERFKTITTTFYRGTHGVIVVYDVTRMESFVGVKRWLLEIENNCDINVNRVLVGNKCDRDDDIAVPSADGQKLAKELNIPFIETSAKENVNIDELFSIVTQLAIDARKSRGGMPDARGEVTAGGGSTVRVRPRSQYNPPPKSKCC